MSGIECCCDTKGCQHPVSLTKLLPTTVRAKSFLSPRYIMFYLSTILFPIHLFTSTLLFFALRAHTPYYPSLEKKTCHYLLRAGRQKHSKTIFPHLCGRENKLVITDLAFKYYHPACGASDIPAKTGEGNTRGDCITESYLAVSSSPHSKALWGDASASNHQ